MIDIICICGHAKRVHNYVGAPIWMEWCGGEKKRDVKKGDFFYTCDCMSYIPDNLTHIEMEAKRKKLI